jgi:hypothetical protein
MDQAKGQLKQRWMFVQAGIQKFRHLGVVSVQWPLRGKLLFKDGGMAGLVGASHGPNQVWTRTYSSTRTYTWGKSWAEPDHIHSGTNLEPASTLSELTAVQLPL